MNVVNFFIVKILVNVKFANIINIAANEEIIPELLQSKCNPKEIYKTVDRFLTDKGTTKEQIEKSQNIINKFKTGNSTQIASKILFDHL